MAMRTFDPESTAARFISLGDITRRYRRAKRRFYTHKRLYQICRENCKYGGSWPVRTRDAKIKAHESARLCRGLQQLKQHLEARRAAVQLG
jgi:hypothetical protein